MAWTDERVEQAMGGLLRAGVFLSAAVVLAGGVWYFATHGNAPVNLGTFRGEPAELRGPDGVMRGVFAGHPGSVIQFGLLLLIATPVARVLFAIAAFSLQRDHLYVAIGILVLAALSYGLTGH